MARYEYRFIRRDRSQRFKYALFHDDDGAAVDALRNIPTGIGIEIWRGMRMVHNQRGPVRPYLRLVKG